MEPVHWQPGPARRPGSSALRWMGHLGVTALLSVALVASLLVGLGLGLSWAALALAVVLTCALASAIGVWRRTSIAGIVLMVVAAHGLAIVGVFVAILVALSTRPAGSKSV